MSTVRNRFHVSAAVRFCLAVGVACLLLTPVASRGGIILGQHDWDNGGEGWSSLMGWTALSDPAGPVGGGWLNVQFDATAQPEELQDEWYDVVYVQAEDLFAGTWTDEMFVEFDFWAEDVVPGAVQLQWTSTTNSDIWGYTFGQSSATGEWSRLSASLGNWQDWMFPGATEDQYLSDLSTIDWIGVYIYRDGSDLQNYQIDNFSLMIPEPAQFVMLASALATSLMALRRRRGRDDDSSGPPDVPV